MAPNSWRVFEVRRARGFFVFLIEKYNLYRCKVLHHFGKNGHIDSKLPAHLTLYQFFCFLGLSI
jgi:hypothetical protein